MSTTLKKMFEEYDKKQAEEKQESAIQFAFYDVAVIDNGWLKIIQNVLALSKIDAMHIAEVKYGVIAKDATISE